MEACSGHNYAIYEPVNMRAAPTITGEQFGNLD